MKIISIVLLIHFVFGQQPTASTNRKAPAHGDAALDKPNTAPDKSHEILARSNKAWTGEATMTFAPDVLPMTSTSTLINS